MLAILGRRDWFPISAQGLARMLGASGVWHACIRRDFILVPVVVGLAAIVALAGQPDSFTARCHTCVLLSYCEASSVLALGLSTCSAAAAPELTVAILRA